MKERRKANVGLIRSVISMMDVVEIVRESHLSGDSRSLADGLDRLFGSFLQFMQDQGLEEILPRTGDAFEDYLHASIDSSGFGEGSRVLEVVRKGYRYQETVIRRAEVKVARHGMNAGAIRNARE